MFLVCLRLAKRFYLYQGYGGGCFKDIVDGFGVVIKEM